MKSDKGRWLVIDGDPNDPFFGAQRILARGRGLKAQTDDGQEVWLNEMDRSLAGSEVVSYREYREPAGWRPRVANEREPAPCGPRSRPSALAERTCLA